MLIQRFPRGATQGLPLLLLLLGLVLLPRPAAAQPVVTGVEVTDVEEIEVTFNVDIDPVTGATIANYQLFESDTPANVVGISAILVSANRATLSLGSALTAVQYTLRTQGIESTAGGDPSSLATTTFMGPGAEVTPIATIQANPAGYEGQTVTVEGVVYIPTDYRQPDSSVYTGYIQDGSGRGLNVFGFSDDPNVDDPVLQTVGNRVRLTGTIDVYNNITELIDLTSVELLGSGESVTPAQVSTQAANSQSYDGTYIEVTGEILSQTTGTNYTVDDGSGPIVVRVVSTVGASNFANGTTIVARGAGSQYQGTFQILVGVASDIAESGGGPDTIPPRVDSASAGSDSQVLVGFNEALDATTAQNAANYSVYESSSPASTVGVSSASLSGSNVTLSLSGTLTADVEYTVEVSGVEDLAGNVIGANNTATFTYVESSAIPIATIQANANSYLGQSVTIEGIVYIPADYRQPDTSIFSGYVQDESGRGINVFGYDDNPYVSDSALSTVGTRVRLTGTVDIYNTTVELADLTALEVLGTGQSVSPAVLSTSAASSSAYEGTFIQVTGEITSQAAGGPGMNYTVNDGSGPIVVRVVDTLSAPSFSTGTTITARGAGGQFIDDFQVLVGVVSDVFEGGGGPDTTPPTLVGASAPAETQVAVSFSEALDAATSQDPTNYDVYVTSNPGTTFGVATASLSGSTVTLTLTSSLSEDVGYTLAVSDVEDLAGNVIAANSTTTFSYTASSAIPIATIQENVSSYVGQSVTIEGVVYIPADYRQPDTSIFSGYVQDASGRGINVFGYDDNPYVSDSALSTVGTWVRLTGTVETYETTVELADLTALEVLGTGQSVSPLVLGTGAAASADYEGTFIQVSGEIASQASGGPGMNITVNDGSGPIVIRVVDTLNAPSFSVGTTITARGAGGQFGSDFQVLVGVATDIFEGSGGEDTTPPTLTGALGIADDQIRVSFSEAIDPTTGGTVGNYGVYPTGSPASTITVSSAVVSGASVTLTLGSALTDGTAYTVSVSNVQDVAGNAMTPDTAAFTYSAGGIIPIASIHEDIDFWEGQEVTIRAQVFIPTNYRSTVTSGYVQDGSGRGLNVFGFGAEASALTDVSNIVEITGEVALYFTTVELLNISNVTLVSTGNPPLQPRVLGSTAEANDDDWEGTYIRVSGNIVAKGETGGAINYTINDGSGPIIARVYPDIGATDYAVGTQVWVSGAGNQYQTDFQIAVGLASDFTDTEPADVSPPLLTQAYRSEAEQLTLRFNETLLSTSVLTPSNYTLRNELDDTVEVLEASLLGTRSVVLSLARDINVNENWELTVVGIADINGNMIVQPQTVAVGSAPPTAARLDGPAKTFLPREGERYPVSMVIPAWTADGAPSEVLLRVFDLQGRLQATLYDSRFETSFANDFEDDYEHTVEWDGRDTYGDRVPAGAYVVHLLVTESTNGKKHDVQMPVVVATRLER